VGLLAYLLKPFVYVAAFWIAMAVFRKHGAHAGFGGKPMAGWSLVVLATVARLALGVPVGMFAVFLIGDASRLGMFAIIVPLGFLLWLCCARVAFPRAPLGGVAAFALAAEVVSGGIDYWAWDDLSSISFC
jgi:hypothetical protein